MLVGTKYSKIHIKKIKNILTMIPFFFFIKAVIDLCCCCDGKGVNIWWSLLSLKFNLSRAICFGVHWVKFTWLYFDYFVFVIVSPSVWRNEWELLDSRLFSIFSLVCAYNSIFNSFLIFRFLCFEKAEQKKMNIINVRAELNGITWTSEWMDNKVIKFI